MSRSARAVITIEEFAMKPVPNGRGAPKSIRGWSRRLSFALLASSLAAPALADAPSQDVLPSPGEVAEADSITVAVGGAILPDYEGSNDYRLIAVGAIRGRIRGVSFITRGSYLYVDVTPANGKVSVDLGPIVGPASTAGAISRMK